MSLLYRKTRAVVEKVSPPAPDLPIGEALKEEAFWLYQATSKTPALKRFKAADEDGLQNDMANERNWHDLVLQVQEIR